MTEKEYRLLTRLELSDDLGYSVSYRGTLSFKQLKAWNEYIEAHSESRIYEEYLSQPLRFKDLRGIPAYLVGTEHYRELTNEYLDTVNILLLRPTSTDRVTFPEWLGSVGLFDVPIAERYGLLDLLYKGLVYRKGVPIAIKEIPKEGAVLLIHEALHREFFGIFRAIVYAEQLRQNLYRRLPYIKLSLSDLESLPENVRLDNINLEESTSEAAPLFLELSEEQILDTLFRKIRLDDPEFRITLRFEDQQKLTIGAQVYVEILIYLKQFITEFFSFVAKVTHDEKPSEQTFTIHYLPHYPETKEFMISEDIVRKIDERFDEIEREKRNEVFMLPTRDNRAVRVSSDLLRATCEVINAQYSTGIGSRRIRNTYDTSSYSYRAVQLFVSGLLDEAQLEELDLNTLFEIYELYGELECIIEEFGFELNQYLLENIHKIDNLEEAVENVLYQQPVNEYTSRFRAQLRWLLSQIRGEYPFTEQDYHQFVRYKMNVERSINYQKKLELSRRYPIEITLLKRVYYYLYVRDYANLQSLYRENLDVWMNHFYNALGALLPDILVKDYRFQVTKITIRVGKQWKLENGPELQYIIEYDPEILGDAENSDDEEENSEDEESAEEDSDDEEEDSDDD